MPKFDVISLSVCLVCLHLIANGEFDDGTDITDRVDAAMRAKWGDAVRHMVAGNEEFGFCTTECDGCGDTNHGDRFEAAILIPA